MAGTFQPQSERDPATKGVKPGQDHQKRRLEDHGSPPLPSAPAAFVSRMISKARIGFWSEKESWPTAEQEATIHPFRDLVNDAHARKRSPSPTLGSDAMSTYTAGSELREQKCVPYRHPLFEFQLKQCGSFMDEHEHGITAESEKCCQQLLDAPQPVPKHTPFSDNALFAKTCQRMKGANKMKAVLTIPQLIIPSAELLADSGAAHFTFVRETNNASWINFEPSIYPAASVSGSRSGPRPQPDFGFGLGIDAFNAERLWKLQPFLDDLLADCSLFAATYQMFFPFLAGGVECGSSELDVANRQNAHAQSLILRGLYSLFRLAGREKELDRIWGHFAVIDGNDVKFYRHLISTFIVAPSGQGDQRWKAYRFVKNIYDVWLPNHIKRLFSAVDMLPAADSSIVGSHVPILQPPITEPVDSSRPALS
ncbi:MAG: hypothetical protein M1825_003893 [Sarcosagium campestre]|nr:MAG: hypothetical protein M1825_003893 [Sarcosagium campestre]